LRADLFLLVLVLKGKLDPAKIITLKSDLGEIFVLCLCVY